MLKLIIAVALVWLLSHGIKVLLKFKKDGKFDTYQLYRAGGMPSGHSAVVTALSLGLFLEQDITSTKNQLDTISKEAGEKLRLKEKELENDKEFLSIKEKLEEKTDEKKKKKTKNKSHQIG